MTLSFHIGSNPNGQARKWYDDVVAAKAYIGPIRAVNTFIENCGRAFDGFVTRPRGRVG